MTQSHTSAKYLDHSEGRKKNKESRIKGGNSACNSHVKIKDNEYDGDFHLCFKIRLEISSLPPVMEVAFILKKIFERNKQRMGDFIIRKHNDRQTRPKIFTLRGRLAMG
mmetsp:Transcript_41848/g.48188  ORF Transcript_41848/g.48188 Transcript_41848/m.48188 type:complete len:109 (+) Transcript_41848:141-467(+)